MWTFGDWGGGEEEEEGEARMEDVQPSDAEARPCRILLRGCTQKQREYIGTQGHAEVTPTHLHGGSAPSRKQG